MIIVLPTPLSYNEFSDKYQLSLWQLEVIIYVGVKVEVDIVVEVDFQLLVRVGFFK